MDSAEIPPVRLQAREYQPISASKALKNVQQYLDDLERRTTAAQGGKTTATVQLQKLTEALKAEKAR
ncbi:hypothetical protein C8J56DRAFT_964904 [Mycena floridula]|nr:hypothetical protein C8J56DRAFT_964904 [Mycena floridula]